jgi:hypothetical protein
MIMEVDGSHDGALAPLLMRSVQSVALHLYLAYLRGKRVPK